MLGVRLNPKIEKQLSRYLAKHKTTRSEVVKQALSAFIAEQETNDWHDEQTLLALGEALKNDFVSEKEALEYLDTWGK
ncbi:hypothetical protein K1X76_10275 [bacterium]|nr:hypothetical protein [bacterium]